MAFQLALFCHLVAEVGQGEWFDVVANVVVGGFGSGAENVAVCFWGGRVAVVVVGLVGGGGLAGGFVGTPVAALAVGAAVLGAHASAAGKGTGLGTGRVEAGAGHDWGFSNFQDGCFLAGLKER